MKKILSLFLCAVCLFSLASVSQGSVLAAGEKPAANAAEVPKLFIDTVNGNGASLEKADGYTDAHIKITDSGNTEADEDVVVKVRGNSTAMAQKKSFTFKFSKKRDVLGMGTGKKWVLLANPFDPTLLRNFVMFDFADELGIAYTSRQKIVELWLDGSFRGCYTLMEPVQDGKDRVDIDTDGNRDFMLEYERLRTDDDTTYVTSNSGLRFGISAPDEPDDGQVAYISDTLNRICDVISYGSRGEIESAVDIESFAKFYVLNEFAKTNDFNFSSVFFYYKDGKFYAGPPWDYDLSTGNENEEFSANSKSAIQTEGLQIADKLFYKQLFTYDWFVLEARRELARHFGYIENIGAEGGLIDSLAAEYADVFNRNYTDAGWTIRYQINVMKYPLPTYEENLVYFRNWCRERSDWLRDYFEVDSLRYLVGDSDGSGVIDVNDVTQLQNLLAELTGDPDGKIALRGGVTGSAPSIADATAIQKYLADIKTAYPVGEYAVM